MKKMDVTSFGALLLGAAALVSATNGQDDKLLREDSHDTTLLNDVQIDSGNGLRRSAPGLTLVDDVDASTSSTEPSGPWIGVGIVPVPAVLRSHLSVDDGVGVVVEQVVPDSPADKAGLRLHDVLTAVDGKPIVGPSTLISAITNANETPLTLTWMRGTQEMSGTVTPTDRPASTGLRAPRQSVELDPEDLGRLRRWVDRLEEDSVDGNGGHLGNSPGPMRMRTTSKGPSSSSSRTVFHDNIQIQIQRSNNGPAKIKVQKDGESWELTEDDLDQLPEDIRTQVESMLGGDVLFGVGAFPSFSGHMLDGLPDMQRAMKDLDGALRGLDGFDHQFNEMNRQMEQILDQMRELRSQQKLLIPAEELEEGDEA